MADLKNINESSNFEHRTGLIVWVKSKRNIKRLMSHGFLHYVSNKMDYAILYVDTKKLDETIARIKNENYVESVEESPLKDLPIEYDDVLTDMQKEIDEKKRKEKLETFAEYSTFDNNDW
jgi:uncharacterized protein YlbG (UPF0298 family)